MLTDEPNQITKKEAIVATVTAVLLFGGRKLSVGSAVVQFKMCNHHSPDEYCNRRRQLHISVAASAAAALSALQGASYSNILKAGQDAASKAPLEPVPAPPELFLEQPQ